MAPNSLQTQATWALIKISNIVIMFVHLVKLWELWYVCDWSHGGRTGSMIVAPGLGKLIFALKV
jgi:hypothetical protein